MCKLYRRNFVKHELMHAHLLGIGVDLLSCKPLGFAWQLSDVTWRYIAHRYICQCLGYCHTTWLARYILIIAHVMKAAAVIGV